MFFLYLVAVIMNNNNNNNNVIIDVGIIISLFSILIPLRNKKIHEKVKGIR